MIRVTLSDVDRQCENIYGFLADQTIFEETSAGNLTTPALSHFEAINAKLQQGLSVEEVGDVRVVCRDSGCLFLGGLALGLLFPYLELEDQDHILLLPDYNQSQVRQSLQLAFTSQLDDNAQSENDEGDQCPGSPGDRMAGNKGGIPIPTASSLDEPSLHNIRLTAPTTRQFRPIEPAAARGIECSDASSPPREICPANSNQYFPSKRVEAGLEDSDHKDDVAMVPQSTEILANADEEVGKYRY